MLALTAALALLGLCAQVSARARPPVLTAMSAAPAAEMAGMDADCMRAMAAAATDPSSAPGGMDMTLDCIAKHGCIVVALISEPAPLDRSVSPPGPPGPIWSVVWREGASSLPEIQPPIAA